MEKQQDDQLISIAHEFSFKRIVGRSDIDGAQERTLGGLR